MINNNLILVGGGGHCKSVIDVAESAGYNILGILDKPSELGKAILAYEVIGTDDDIPNYVNKAQFVISVGQIKSNDTRKKIYKLLQDAGAQLATIIADDAYVSKYAKIGEGSVIMHKAFVNADARIGKCCIINTMANIEHDVEIGDYCHISTGTIINGGCKIGNNVFVGSQSVLKQGVTISGNSIVPAGTFVKQDI